MVLVRKFFCFDLYTTGLLVGWLGLAGAITSCITSILMLENLDAFLPNEKFNETDYKYARSVCVNLLGANIALKVIDLLASGLLITGTVKRNRLLLLPWLINATMSLAFVLIAFFTALVVILTTSNDVNYGAVVFVVIIAAVIYGVCVYAYISIHSLYQIIRMDSSPSEYSRLIEDRNAHGHPIYSRC